MAQLDKRDIREASVWFARMHHPDASDRQADFNAWLAASEVHRDAYSRVSEAFSLGKNLQPHSSPASEDVTRSSKPKWKIAATVALLLSAGGIAIVATGRDDPAAPQSSQLVDSATTRVGQIRTLRLSDGSAVTLDTDTQLTMRFTSANRDLWLLNGRARFDVAHEGRPFVVHAGSGTVTAHGTVFDVRIYADSVSVRLLRGAIDVKLPRNAHHPAMVRRISPGTFVAFDETNGITTVPTHGTAAIAQPSWPGALLDFDAVRVDDLASEANRYSSTHLIVDEPQVAEMRVSGTFRMGNPAQLADHLATLLDLRATRQPSGDVTLSRKAP